MVAAIAASLILAPATALARKPGPTTGSASVVATPNPVAVGSPVTISGSGYRANNQLQVELVTSTSDTYLYAASNGSGSFSLTTTMWSSGTVQVRVWQIERRGASLQASTSFTVQ